MKGMKRLRRAYSTVARSWEKPRSITSSALNFLARQSACINGVTRAR